MPHRDHAHKSTYAQGADAKLAAALQDAGAKLATAGDRYCSLTAQLLHARLSLCRPGQAKRDASWLAMDDESSDSNSSGSYYCT